ncbi:uncharacterized protein LOC144447380 isoform X2 [Glandiceps talaboti]
MEEGTSLSREKFGFNMFVILLLLLTNLEVVIGQNCSRPDVEGSPISDGRLPQLNPDQLQYIENESVTFNCSESNDIIFGPPNVVCESDGNWSIDLFPKCLAMCSDPGSPEGGNKTGTSEYTPHSVVNFVCNQQSDTLLGSDTITCIDGQWDGDVPECLSGCSDPGTPSNGTQFKTDTSFKHGGTVNFTCDEGYFRVGNEALYCTSGKWSGDIPSCEDMNECSSEPCFNGAECVNQVNMYKCQCVTGFEGTNCEDVSTVKTTTLATTAPTTSSSTESTTASTSKAPKRTTEVSTTGEDITNSPKSTSAVTAGTTTYLSYMTSTEGSTMTKSSAVSTYSTAVKASTTEQVSTPSKSITTAESTGPIAETQRSTESPQSNIPPGPTSQTTVMITTGMTTTVDTAPTQQDTDTPTVSTNPLSGTTEKMSTLSHSITTAESTGPVTETQGSTESPQSTLPPAPTSQTTVMITTGMTTTVDSAPTQQDTDTQTVSTNPLSGTTEKKSPPSDSITTVESTGSVTETQRSTESPQSTLPPAPTSQTTVMITTGMTTTVDTAPTQLQDTDTSTVSTNPLSGTTEKMSTLSHSITTAESTGPVTETQGSTESPQSTLPPAPTSQTTVMITTGMTTTVDSAPTQQDTDTQTVSTNPLSGTTEKMSPPSDSITTVESTGSVTETQRSTESPQSTLPPAPTSQTTVMITTGMTTTVDTAPTQLQDTDTSTVSTNPLSGTTEKMSTLSHSITTAESTGPVTETQGSTESPQSTLPPAPTSQTIVMITTGMTTTVDSAPTQQDTDTQTVSTNPLSGTTEKVSMPSHSITTVESTRPVTETQRSTESSPSTLPPAGTTKEQTPTHNVQTTVGSTHVQSSTTLSTTVQGGTVGTTHPQSATLSVMPTTTKAGTTKEQLPTQDIETTVGSTPAQNSVALSTTLQSGTTKEQTPKEDAESTVGSTRVQSSTVSGTSTTIQAGITKEQTSTPNVETTSVRSTQTQSSTVSTTKCIDDPCDSNTQYCVDNTTGYNCRCKATTRRKDNDCLLVKTFRGGFKMKDVNFSDDLNDPDSSKYKSLVTTVTTKVDTLMININNLYVTSDILGFKPGSVVVDFISSFDVEAVVTTEDIENRFVVEANSTNGVFSNFAIDEMSFIEFNDTVCVIPGGHDCSEDASCVNTSDGSFTCVCISGYEDESKYDTRPGRQCIVSMIQDHSTFFTPIVITSIVVAGVLFLSLFLFVTHYCLLSRKDATVVRVPFEEDFHSAVHPLVDPGVHHNMSHQMYEYTSTLQVEDDIRRVDCPSDKVDDGNGSTLAIPKYGAESYVEDESVDNRLDSLLRQVKQSSMLMQTGEPIHDMSRSPEISSDRLETRSTDNEFMRPYIATGDEEQYLQRRDYEGRRRDIPLRDYTEDYYRPPRTQGNYILPDIRTRLNNLPYQIPRPSTETLP